MRTLLVALPALVVAAAAGCGGGGGPAAPTAPVPTLPAGPTPAAEDRPWVESADYANWKRFKVNTTVVRKKVSKNAADSVTETRTLRLVELTPAKAVVESQVTVERPGGPPKVNPPVRLDYPAQFRLPPGMTAEQFEKPSLKAKEDGQETLTVGGTEYPTKRFAWEDATEAGPMPNRLWLSDAVPGRFVKQEMRVEKTNTSTTEVVVEVKLAE